MEHQSWKTGYNSHQIDLGVKIRSQCARKREAGGDGALWFVFFNFFFFFFLLLSSRNWLWYTTSQVLMN